VTRSPLVDLVSEEIGRHRNVCWQIEESAFILEMTKVLSCHSPDANKKMSVDPANRGQSRKAANEFYAGDDIYNLFFPISYWINRMMIVNAGPSLDLPVFFLHAGLLEGRQSLVRVRVSVRPLIGRIGRIAFVVGRAARIFHFRHHL